MSKEKFNRSNVKSTILNKIVIRMDFIGLTDIEGCVNSLKRIMNGKFKKFTPINNNNYNVVLPDQFNNFQGPNVNFEKRIIYQFSESLIGPSKANFMLGPDFAYIEVGCDSNYEGCGEYIRLMATAVDYILRFDSFISVKRLGLRKIDIAEFDSIEAMNESVETQIWNNYKRDDAYLPLKKSYSDLLLQKDVNTVFNIQRHIQVIEVGGQRKYQFIFDIDSYKSGNLINNEYFANMESIEKTISEQMNQPIFNYFIETFTEQYINQFYHE